MNNINTKKILSAAKITVLALIVALGIQYIYAFTNPPGAPTTCPTGYSGCDAPINVSTTAQTKTGPLTVNTASTSAVGFTAWGQSVFNSTGYGGSAIQIIDGNQGAGKVLTSDASGNATWQTEGSLTVLNSNCYFYGSSIATSPAVGLASSYNLSSCGVPANATAVIIDATLEITILPSSSGGDWSLWAGPSTPSAYVAGVHGDNPGGNNLSFENTDQVVVPISGQTIHVAANPIGASAPAWLKLSVAGWYTNTASE